MSRDVLLMGLPAYTPPPPKFARAAAKGGNYEYGTVAINHVDRANDRYTVLGKAPTMAEAMTLNEMEALNGHVKEGF